MVGADAAPHLQAFLVGAVGEKLQDIEAPVAEALDVRVCPPEWEGVPNVRFAEGGFPGLDEVLGPGLTDLGVVVHGKPGPEAVDERVDARSRHVVYGRDGVFHPDRRVVGVDVGMPGVAVEDQTLLAHVVVPSLLRHHGIPNDARGVGCSITSSALSQTMGAPSPAGRASSDRVISFQPCTSTSGGRPISREAAR